ncbi:Gfo/Idh/MocA family oxidoreductase [Desulfosporosinus fructosivorans]|uniref:Gfo/Idh/MocA family oxidoreductase n=1 Tax=Desulfosporosinus fructosivorans TaxID=2018669 RepID=A0A4Z0RAR5_9FIRM|nr:Gfo/Idh/MocA family oxidoreductase [Desulfosporosinus fructosivorans]TGE39103.1 Gfo/Idh/MocA family oxidoreductase [Desulfosporosinus fructosivorans]
MYNSVGVAAVGLGRWAYVLADAYTRSGKVKLVTCFSRTSDKRDKFAQRYDCGTDLSMEALLARDDVEMVIVTVPNDKHAEVIEQCARAGKHVYVEKPISVSVEDAKRIDKVIKETGVKFLCGHSSRRLGALRKIKEMIDTKEIGEVSTIEAVFSNERGLELKKGNWRGDPATAPGGPLTQLGVHQIDNLQFLLGPIARVFNFGKPMYTEVENITVNQTILEFENGKQAYLGTNWACPGVFSINVYGTKANLFYQLDFSWWSNSDVTDEHSTLIKREFASMSDDPDDRILRDVKVEFETIDHLRVEVEEVADVIRNGGETEIGAEASLRNLAVVLAAVKSVHEKRPVEISEIII